MSSLCTKKSSRRDEFGGKPSAKGIKRDATTKCARWDKEWRWLNGNFCRSNSLKKIAWRDGLAGGRNGDGVRCWAPVKLYYIKVCVHVRCLFIENIQKLIKKRMLCLVLFPLLVSTVSTSACSNCKTADFKNAGKLQQEPSSKISGNSDKIDYQKTEHGFHREFSDQQILFFFLARILVIAIVDLFCLLKLAQTSWFERSSSGNTPLTVCEENSIYFTTCSTTFGFILPPPESNNLVKGPKDISAHNGQEPSTHLQEGEEEESQEEFKTTETEDADETDCAEKVFSFR